MAEALSVDINSDQHHCKKDYKNKNKISKEMPDIEQINKLTRSKELKYL